MAKGNDILGFYYNADSCTELSTTQTILDCGIFIQICPLDIHYFSLIYRINLFVIYYQLTTWSRVVLEKVIAAQLVNNIKLKHLREFKDKHLRWGN
jgi:hypothetical protein